MGSLAFACKIQQTRNGNSAKLPTTSAKLWRTPKSFRHDWDKKTLVCLPAPLLVGTPNGMADADFACSALFADPTPKNAQSVPLEQLWKAKNAERHQARHNDKANGFFVAHTPN